MSQAPVYLDHHAATPLCADAIEAMDEAQAAWANPASAHAAGRQARSILEKARGRVARAVGAHVSSVIFVSGGTEALNLGIHSALRAHAASGSSVILTTSQEHPAVYEPLERSAERAATLRVLPCLRGLLPSAADVASAIDSQRANGSLVTLAVLLWASHETGALMDAEAVAAVCESRSVPLLLDATQALGKVPIDVSRLPGVSLALAASKIGGPCGAGALITAKGAELDPLLIGGGQERGRRAGTPGVRALAGFGGACEGLAKRLDVMAAIGARRDALERALEKRGALISAHEAPRVATVTHAALRGWRGPALVAALDLTGLMASSGAACSSGVDEPSRAILAAYPDEPWRASAALRLSLGPETTDRDVEHACAALDTVLARVPA